jgi:hypothetical protein
MLDDGGHGPGQADAQEEMEVPDEELTPEALELLPSHLARFFQEYGVLHLDGIRTLLCRDEDNEVLRCAGENASDAALRAAIDETGKYERIRDVYVRKGMGHIKGWQGSPEDVRRLRTVIIELLKKTEELVGSRDVKAAAAEKGVPYDFRVCQVLMGELGDPWLGKWKLKDGLAALGNKSPLMQAIDILFA